MLIGELARQSGVPAKTIRYYEQIGLLDAPVRTAGGYRDYDNTALARLAFIRAARSLELGVGEIRGIVALRDQGETPCTHVLELLAARTAELAGRIAELQTLRKELRRLVARSKTLRASDCDPDRVCHLIGTA